jgi:hypothetical protein
MTMKKILMGAAAAAVGLAMGNGAAFANSTSCSDLTSNNQNIYYVDGPSSGPSASLVGELTFSGNSGNATGDVLVTSSQTCIAMNRQSGNPVEGQNQTIFTEELLEGVRVCQNSGQQSSTSLFDGISCSNPRWNG